ncbi:polyprenyl synthetase family protein [Tropicimonas sp. IMCC34043]|uniref:polyprenyl synthetase family protein n=1 Tax=Tropicimonas sp. IMCC34043 TaxID=2248760 RepID=UPI000E22303B|nr:polyprenyl synthetase family protein [Tropicimonas sp. IMCC34043]
MDQRIEAAISRAIGLGQTPPTPPKLASALEYAVFPGGARVRPMLALAVAKACGDDCPELTDAACVAIELMHCASLVHDDLPCFDDAGIRRGKPSVHAAFGEPLAILAGDTLIIMAFEVLARAGTVDPARALSLVTTLGRASGMPGGICAGQGWESEPCVDLSAYHKAKTGSLFVAATTMGAIAGGSDPAAWTELGMRIGEAFQVADDLRDAVLDEETLGKPVGQDAVHGRPNAVADLGIDGAIRRLQDTLGGAISSIPSCPGEATLAQIVRGQADRLTPMGVKLKVG